MHTLTSFGVIFTSFVCLLSNVGFSFGISCKDENNRDVDWFIVSKLPKIETEPKGSNLNRGKAYAYITSGGPKLWTFSSRGIGSKTSILGRTWQDFDNKRKYADTASMFYNDDAPDPYKKSSVGHIKGYFAFDADTGFWLAHSIPNFGQSELYEYPRSGYNNGQHALCITTSTASLSEICNYLLYCNPNVYQKDIEGSILQTLDKNAKTLFSDSPNFIRKKPFERKSTLESLGKVVFHTFAKDNQLHAELYSQLLAPSFDTPLIAETWRNGAGGILPPACKTMYPVTDATSISMTTANRHEPIEFNSSNDHSKWAIAMDGMDPWVCIADLNRVGSQAKRGGGAICFQSRDVWTAYKSLVAGTDMCPA